MRDYTNLNWPDGPFGAEFRPFGRPSKLLTAVAIGWTSTGAYRAVSVPVAACSVYLRIRAAQTLDVSGDTLAVGFRVTVVEAQEDTEDQLGVVDRCLIGARRHAAILAGQYLERDLDRLDQVANRRLPGVIGVREAWAARSVKGRGLATMIDTGLDLTGQSLPLDAPLDLPQVMTIPETAADASRVAQHALQCCLAIGLTAAAHAGRMTWTHTFPVVAAVSTTAWDVFAARSNA
jgi:hypothetical protein